MGIVTGVVLFFRAMFASRTRVVAENLALRHQLGVLRRAGKTLSFTSVAAAAHDNRFRCVAVIAGSSLNLADQNKDRLAKDLDIGANFRRPWHRAHNPTTAQLHELNTALAGWETGRPKTLLLTSLKHHRHVQNLGALIAALGDAASPMLIIDDEADQISLNTRVNQSGESANYSQILGLRDRAPRHTYLQYTATPQANIFIPLWDRLSPESSRPVSEFCGDSGASMIPAALARRRQRMTPRARMAATSRRRSVGERSRALFGGMSRLPCRLLVTYAT